ncbi:MAG: CHAD domain-containing protein [Actinobacteria bacterium]|nr:CHAD domain-containing protein [Actinomycetota bacterium]
MPVAQVDREVLLAPLATRRHTARRKLREAVRSHRYTRLLNSLESAAQAPPLRGKSGRRASKVLPPLVESRWRALWREVRRVGSSPAPAELHAIRIRAKRARYAAEAAGPALGAPARRFAKRMEQLQELLGNHHDAVVAAAWLREISIGADARLAFLAGEVAGLQDAEADGVAREWPRAWKRARHKRYREWL